jgi:hypothetical protein
MTDFARIFPTGHYGARPGFRIAELQISPSQKVEFLPPYSSELTRRKIFGRRSARKSSRTTHSKSMDKVYDKLQEAALYLERNPKIVQSITAFPYIAK